MWITDFLLVYSFFSFLLSLTYTYHPNTVAQMVKNPPAMQETRVRSLGQEDPLEKGMATHSSILAWRIPWTEEAGGLQSMGSQRVGHNWAINTTTNTPAASFHVFAFIISVFIVFLVWISNGLLFPHCFSAFVKAMGDGKSSHRSPEMLKKKKKKGTTFHLLTVFGH